MDRAEASRIAHTLHPIAAPVSPERARWLLSLLALPGDGRALDLGCGCGEWLLTLLEGDGGGAPCGVGVDTSIGALADARVSAEKRGLDGKVTWENADAATWAGGLFDVVLCVGATHAFGGLDGALAALRRHLRPGGRALLGDAIWEAAPSRAAQEALDAGPNDFPDLAGLVDRVRTHGFEPLFGHVSTLEEWDDYEWSWTGSLAEWALARDAGDEDAREALEIARTHREEWLTGYRKQLGFVTLVLHEMGAAVAPEKTPTL